MGLCEGSTKSLLCVYIFRATTRGGKGLPGDLVLYEQALQKERVVLLAPLNVPCRAVRAGASCHALQPQKTFGHAGWNRTTSVPLLPLLVS